MQLILLSNSTNPGSDYLSHAKSFLLQELQPKVKTVAFIPYAGVTIDYHSYTEKVRRALPEFIITSVHEVSDPGKLIKESDALFVGGGNTFRLLDLVYTTGIYGVIANEVNMGKPYVGWSAGSNLACPSIRTTNDMPIIFPPSFSAFNFIPFQINPHYLDTHPDFHMGETREQRLMEFLEINKEIKVVGLREGSWLHLNQGKLSLFGNGKTARIFQKGIEAVEWDENSDWGSLL